jgi:hypothetical protein
MMGLSGFKILNQGMNESVVLALEEGPPKMSLMTEMKVVIENSAIHIPKIKKHETIFT